MAHKIILDVDLANGMGPARDVDDGLALALALTSPEVELLGCTTCAGNCRTSESTRQTLLFLEQAGRTDIPVAEGREEPLLADHRANFEYYDQRSAGFIGEETLWPETAQSWDLLHPGPTTEKSPLKAHEFIIEMVQRYPGEVTIIKEGSLTNLAMALLVEPSIAGKVKEVIRKSTRIVRLGFFLYLLFAHYLPALCPLLAHLKKLLRADMGGSFTPRDSSPGGGSRASRGST